MLGHMPLLAPCSPRHRLILSLSKDEVRATLDSASFRIETQADNRL